MPRTCAIEKCKHKWRVTCSCCNQNLCHDHFKEHTDSNKNPQLKPLMNEIQNLDKQIQSSNRMKLIGNCRIKLDQWRENAHQMIDRFYQDKCQELDQRSLDKLEEQRAQLNQIRAKVNEVLRQQQETNEEQSNAMPTTLQEIQQDLKAIEDTHFQVEIRPLTIEKNEILIEEIQPNECRLSDLRNPFRAIDCSGEWGPVLAKNNRYLLIDRHPNLCLVNLQLEIVKQSPWKFDFIRDMTWSSALNSFIVTTRSREIYLVHENTLATELIQTIAEQDWSSCTCSETSLYLTARREGTNIFQFNLSPSFELIKRWKPPHSCKQYEIILNSEYQNNKLALLISHTSTNLVQLELRSSTTLDRLWSVRLDMTHTIGQPLIRCSALKFDQWLVVDNNTSQIVHLDKDGQIKTTAVYDPSPWNAILFASNLLAVRTKNSVNFHKFL